MGGRERETRVGISKGQKVHTTTKYFASRRNQE